MKSNSRLAKINPIDPAYLVYSSGGGISDIAPLAAGESLFVGAGSNCGIQIKEDSVQQLHCMFMLEENNVLKLQDWNTGTTFLNGLSVREAVVVKSGDLITVGSYCLTAVLDAEFHKAAAAKLLGSGSDESEGNAQNTAAPSTTEDGAVDQAPSCEPDSDAFVSGYFVGDDSDVPTDESEAKESGFKYNFDADLEGEDSFHLPVFDSSHSDMQFPLNTDNGDETTLLLIEIEQLRFEVSERDAQIIALKDARGAIQASTMDDANTLKLVSRLEELLDELKSSDDRIQGLEELLRVSEQATAAERDERFQMEKWITEIEKRISQREYESQAEIDGLTKQLKIAKDDAGVIHSQLHSLAAVRDGSEQHDDVVAALNEQIESLRVSLQEANEKNRELLERPVLSKDEVDLKAKLLKKEDELAKVRLEASRERAEMARQHAELECIRDELEMRLKQAPRDVDKSDSRIRAMREHLKEIHAEETAAKAEQKSNSLGGRIANLLARVR